MANIRSYKELRVWRGAMDAAMIVFELSTRFPVEERCSLTDQIRRSSRSVAANVAEAWRKRRYPAAFVSKLNECEGEAAETQTHVEIARRCKYVNDSDAQSIDSQYEEIIGQLVKMASHPEQWTIENATNPSPRPRVSQSPRQSPPPPPRVSPSPRQSSPPRPSRSKEAL